MNTCIVIHALVTWCLVGLIWVIQVVHYPLLQNVGQSKFVAYHERHTALITWVVGPLMLAEVGSAGLLLLLGERSWLFGISLLSLAGVWASTGFLQIPLHQRLTCKYDAATVDRLVATNWWRTTAWTVRGVCLGTMREAGKRCGLKDSAALLLKRRIAADLIEFFGEEVIRRLLEGLRPGWESDLRTLRDRHVSLVLNAVEPSRVQTRG